MHRATFDSIGKAFLGSAILLLVLRLFVVDFLVPHFVIILTLFRGFSILFLIVRLLLLGLLAMLFALV